MRRTAVPSYGSTTLELRSSCPLAQLLGAGGRRRGSTKAPLANAKCSRLDRRANGGVCWRLAVRRAHGARGLGAAIGAAHAGVHPATRRREECAAKTIAVDVGRFAGPCGMSWPGGAALAGAQGRADASVPTGSERRTARCGRPGVPPRAWRGAAPRLARGRRELQRQPRSRLRARRLRCALVLGAAEWPALRLQELGPSP